MRKMKQSCESGQKEQTPNVHLINQLFEGEPSGDVTAAPHALQNARRAKK